MKIQNKKPIEEYEHLFKSVEEKLIFEKYFINQMSESEIEKSTNLNLDEIDYYIEEVQDKIDREDNTKVKSKIKIKKVAEKKDLKLSKQEIKQLKDYVKTIPKSMDKYIPRAKSTYIDTENDLNILSKIYLANLNVGEKEPLNCLFSGESGTGKTQLLVAFATLWKIPILNFSVNGETSTEQIFGQNHLSIENGVQTEKWTDGQLIEFIKNGGIVVFEEINTMHESIQTSLFSIMDKLQKLSLSSNENEIVKRNKGFMFCATQNKGYSGTSELNEAFLSRFSYKREMEYNTKVEKKLVKLGKILNEKIVNLAKIQRKATINGDYRKSISTRDLIVHKQMCDIIGEEKALENLINIFDGEIEKSAIKELWELQ